MKDGHQGSWFGGAAGGHNLHTVRRAASELQLSSVRPPPEPRPGSVSPSINFSYPRARLQSPTGSLRSLQLEDQTLVYDPNSRRMVPRAQLHARSEAIYEEDYDDHFRAEPLPKRQPKQPKAPKQPKLSRAGSHLSRGTVGRTRAPALETNEVQNTRVSNAVAEPEPVTALEPESIATPPKVKAKKKKKKRSEQAESVAATPAVLPERETPTENEVSTGYTLGPESSPALAPKSKKTTPPATKVKDATPSPGPMSKVSVVATREPSSSPARSARFATATDQLVVRHEPPPRSLSPRKSALKQASPTRAISPSDDGSDVSGVPNSLSPNDEARKKSFRVSWDDRNTVVVTEPTVQHAAEQAASSSPQTKKPWLAIVGKSIKKETVAVEKEETMSPRPALPSFGSVREKKPKEQEERPLVRPEHAATGELTPTVATSAAVANEPNAPESREPLPAVLPSVEQDEQVSSSEDGLMEDTSDEDADSEIGTHHLAPDGMAAKNGSDTVPEISVSHASARQPQEVEESGITRPSRLEEDLSSDGDDVEGSDAEDHAGLQMDDIKEEEEEGDTYTDAHEEINEADGNGFLSLDAVLESPTTSPVVKTTKDLAVHEAKEAKAMEQPGEPTEAPDDWENAKAYWKSLSSEKRRQLEQEAMDEADDDSQEPKTAEADNRNITSKVNDRTTTPKGERTYQILPGTTVDSTLDYTPESSKANGTTFRKSMKESQHAESTKSEPHKLGSSLRKSMRAERPVSAGGESLAQRFVESGSPSSTPRMKRSLRQSSVDLDSSVVRPSLSVTDRPASYHAAGTSLRNMQSPRSNGAASPVSAKRASSLKPSLRRRGSDSSESSFTRARAGTSGSHDFRKSMRSSMRVPPATSDGVRDNSRFSLRPHSPPAVGVRRNSVSSLPPAASFGTGRMRHSLRGESANAPSRKRMSAFSKAKKAKGGSRFGDSSDEDESSMNLNMFKSRFADSSSDDDEPKSKGKSLPKSLRAKSNRATASAIELPFSSNGRESPNLYDNDTTLVPPKRLQQLPGSPLQQTEASQGSLVPLPQVGGSDASEYGSFRPQHTRRGSFISLLRRKKEPATRISRDVAVSATRPDPRLEHNAEELDALRNPTLHKRGPSWPLPEPEDTGPSAAQHSPERPSTAGGPIVDPSSKKSKFMRRRSASQGMVPADTVDMDDDGITDAAPPKKKKFGALRKIFRLHD